MKNRYPFFWNIFIFVFAQLVWLTLLGLWIYWFVSNYIIFSQVGEKFSPQLISGNKNVVTLVVGIVLLIMISVGMSLLFRHLTVQIKMARLYDNFIANVTHELKSPLASIQLFLDTLIQEEIPREKQIEFIHTMLKDTERLGGLIKSILEIPGLEHKRIAHHFTVSPADETFKTLIIESARQFKIAFDAISIEGSAKCDCVLDKNAIKIVIDNLLGNSIKYSHEPLHIQIKLASTDKKLLLDFTDNGIGIPMGEQKKIFEKFYRIQDKNAPSVKGTGLGLYWVREIILFHGGKISVNSRGVNRGSTFRIELPIYRTSKKRHFDRLLKIKKNQFIREKNEHN